MKAFIQSWEEACSKTDQSTYNEPIIEQHVSESCFNFDNPFFVIIDFYERELAFPEESKEVVLILSNGPSSEVRYAHLVDRWATIPVSIGMVVSVLPKDGWIYSSDDQNLYQNSLSCYINDVTRGFVVFPHYLVKTSSFSVFRSCPRAVFFRETHMLNDPTLFSLFGRFATITLQKYIQNICNGNAVTAAEIVDQLKKEYIIQLHHLSAIQNDEKFHAIKTIEDFFRTIDSFAEKIDEPHAVYMTIPHTKGLKTVSKSFPGFGAKNYINDETIWSFNQGIVGRPNCIVEIEDQPEKKSEKNDQKSHQKGTQKSNQNSESSEENHFSSDSINDDEIEEIDSKINQSKYESKIVPIEVIATVSSNEVTQLKNGHVLSLTAQMNLLSEKFNQTQTDFSFIWYIGSNQKFWVHPSSQEFITFLQMRNSIAGCIADDDLPPMRISSDCETCLSKETCALFERMKDSREYVYEIDRKLPKTMNDFSLNMGRTFFNHYHKQIATDSLSMMWCCIRMFTNKIQNRIKSKHALGNLTISAIENNQSMSPSALMYNLIIWSKNPGEYYNSSLSRLDDVIITRNGEMPILGFGTVTKIKDDHIEITTYEKCFRVGEIICIDFFKSNQWFNSDNATLSLLLINEHFSRIRSLLIDEKKPLFSQDNFPFDSTGLNLLQAEAVSKALKANDYFLINAPHGTGRLAVGLRIVASTLQNIKDDEPFKILIAPHFYSTVNKICEGLEIMNIPYVVGGKEQRIKEKYRYRFEDRLYSSCGTVEDSQKLTKKLRVFVIPSLAKQFDTLFNREFDLVIIYEASRLPVLRSVHSLNSKCPFILFGNTILENGNDSIFSHLQKINNGNQIINLWEMYNCEPEIVEIAKLAYGDELRCLSKHANVDVKPLKVIQKSIRGFLENIVSMNHPIIFVNVNNFSASVMITIAAGLIYEKVNLIADKTLLPSLCSSIYQCQHNGNLVFTKYVSFLQHAAQRVKYYYSKAMMSKRKDMCIAVADSPDSIMLQTCLGMTRRKLILIGQLDMVLRSPLWLKMLGKIPIIDFPDEYVENEISPFKPLKPIYESFEM
ncbi:hypothetical protein TRFO_17669 [Tritrichomonas foetus]|uniref:DNA replication factor Dna2 N-terminal domain-containing protein n=1 Tax=Tritrichomonas foetus TaxID=1144522 RepID=A0A1J4KN07_9EUKA|nr:hypothetical protein TRFO_17669 [Tritrichomonas foetus]|eukprot:OHT12498.1 hypothetical protein TRFO_17669 [Tritrichomonas foetus]